MYCVTKGCYNQIGISGLDDAETGLCKECYEKSLKKRVIFEQIGKPCKGCKAEISPMNWCFLSAEESVKASHRNHFYCKECCDKKK